MSIELFRHAIHFGFFKDPTFAAPGNCAVLEARGGAVIGLVSADGHLVARMGDVEGATWTTADRQTWTGGNGYLSEGEAPGIAIAQAALRSRLNGFLVPLAAHSVVIVAQAYDRRPNAAAQGWIQPAVLASLPVVYAEAVRTHPNVVALLAFAWDRLGGTRDYPEVIAAWQTVADAVPGHPAVPQALNPPGTEFLTAYPRNIGRTGRYVVAEVADRKNPGTGVLVELIDSSIHITLSNRAGRNRSGKQRLVKW